MNEIFEEIIDTKKYDYKIFFHIITSGFRRDYACFVQRLPHEESLNNKSVLPKILKPSIKLKILSDSEADGNKTKSAFDARSNATFNGLSLSLQVNEKINKIRSIRGNNSLLNKIKKQMELRRNFDEIFKEVETKTAEIERKMMENKFNTCKSSDKVMIYKSILGPSDDKAALKVTSYDGLGFNSEMKPNKLSKVSKLNKKVKVILPNIR